MCLWTLFVPSVYQPRRPRASPLWQILHHAWGEFLATYEQCHCKAHGPLRRNTVAVQTFGDYLVFHPHLHVLAATGLYDSEGTFHELPVEKRRGIGGVLDGVEAEPGG